MAINVNHSAPFSQYGMAMYDSSRNQENYERYQQLMELLMQKRKMEQEQAFEQERSNNEKARLAEGARQFDVSEKNRQFANQPISTHTPVQPGESLGERALRNREILYKMGQLGRADLRGY